jgi:mannose-6-phosphate isomerase-like protein (cupin superfamily)
VQVDDEHRFVELMPPGAPCSIALTTGHVDSEPGSLQGIQLNVDNVDEIHASLRDRGVDVSGSRSTRGAASVLLRPRRQRLVGPRTADGKIAAVPFTLRNLKEDLEDFGSNFDGAPDLEFRLASKALELEQSGLSYQRIPPDYRFPYGHTHKEQEEVYVVVRGSGRMKLDDEIVEVKEWDAVRVPPGTWRGYEGGPEGLEILVFGAPNLGENPREDVEGQRDWWG